MASNTCFDVEIRMMHLVKRLKIVFYRLRNICLNFVNNSDRHASLLCIAIKLDCTHQALGVRLAVTLTWENIRRLDRCASQT